MNRKEAWEKYNAQRPPGDISAQPAFDAAWKAAMDAASAACVAQKVGDGMLTGTRKAAVHDGACNDCVAAIDALHA